MNLIAISFFFWFIYVARQMFFWLYLWQIKDYHIGRFLDHFTTFKGKRIFLNYFFFGKLTLLFVSFIFPLIWPIILLFYAFEAGRTLLHAFRKNILVPVLTAKTLALLFVGLLYVKFLVRFLWNSNVSIDSLFFWLLFFDIASPVLFSFLVLVFQPFAVLGRNRILAQARKKRAELPSLKVIGITGSYGKTSTKEFLAHILSKRFRVLKTKEHRNSEVGISQTILRELDKNHEVFVCEMGAYNKGGIHLLCGIARPSIGMLTGLNEQHMATFGSQENIIEAKFELIRDLPREGFAILNKDNELIRSHAGVQMKGAKVQSSLFCSAKEKADVFVEDMREERDSLSFNVCLKEGDRAQFRVPFGGKHNVQNLLLAIACAHRLGMSLQDISNICRDIPQELNGLRAQKSAYGFEVIDSSYSANPDGVLAEIEHLALWKGKKVVVMPCLIELGKASQEVHRRIGKKIAKVCDLAIITTRDRFEDMREETDKVICMEHSREIAEKIQSFCKEGDIVLLEGRVPSKLSKFLLQK